MEQTAEKTSVIAGKGIPTERQLNKHRAPHSSLLTPHSLHCLLPAAFRQKLLNYLKRKNAELTSTFHVPQKQTSNA